MDFDFLTEKKAEPLIPEVVERGPNTTDVRKKGRKDIIQDVVDIYFEPGMGKDMMRVHMKTDPKAYFDVVKKMIPNQLSLDANEMLNVKLIDRYGNEIEFGSREGESSRRQALALPRGSEPSSPDRPDSPNIVMRERFEAAQKSETVTSNTHEFDFTL